MASVGSAWTVPWKPLSRMRTHEQVVAEVEHRLRSGALKAGDRLPPERQFAEALGVSRGAVREALRILEALGIIEAGTGSGPSSGSVIVKDGIAGMSLVLRLHEGLASFSAANLDEVRLAIERATIVKAAKLATPTDLADLHALVEHMRAASAGATMRDLRAAFRTRVVRAADNALAEVLIGALAESETHSPKTDFDEPDLTAHNVQRIADEYAAIVQAISAGDGNQAAERLATSQAGKEQADGPSALKWAG